MIIIFNILVEIKLSTRDDISNNINITIENIVCLIISNLIFSFLLSFTIDLYNLNPLTPNANITGIKIRFCNNIEININIKPFEKPIVLTKIAIVYPKENPLYKTIPKTIGSPYYSCSKKPYSKCN